MIQDLSEQKETTVSPKIFDYSCVDLMCHQTKGVVDNFLNLLENLYLKDEATDLETLEQVFDLFRQVRLDGSPIYQNMGAAAAAHQTPEIIKKIISLYEKLCSGAYNKEISGSVWMPR